MLLATMIPGPNCSISLAQVKGIEQRTLAMHSSQYPPGPHGTQPNPVGSYKEPSAKLFTREIK